MVNQIKNQHDFTQVFKEFNSDIFNYVYFRTGKKKARAEDITQNIFLKIWKKRKTINKNKSLKSWIYTIARNTVIDYYRTKKKKLSIDSNHMYDYLESEKPNNEDPLMFDYISKMMAKLSKKDQEIITLRYINELEIKEVAKVIKKSYSATKVAIHRSIKRLTKILNDEQSRKNN